MQSTGRPRRHDEPVGCVLRTAGRWTLQVIMMQICVLQVCMCRCGGAGGGASWQIRRRSSGVKAGKAAVGAGTVTVTWQPSPSPTQPPRLPLLSPCICGYVGDVLWHCVVLRVS